MGVIFSKFRKEKTTAVVLEGLEEQIRQLEKYTINTQERKKRFVGNFLAISIGVYVVVFVFLYFFYFPPTWSERIMYLVPLMLFPFVIILLRKLFTWYFQRKLNKNADKLSVLRDKKAKILEQVMDKETYKVAVNLLERFGDKKQNLISLAKPTANASSPNALDNTILNRSIIPGTPQIKTGTLTPYRSIYRSMEQQIVASTQPQHQLHLSPSSQVHSGQELRRRTPFPIIDLRNRSAFDRIIDALVGDNPHDRFAMICKECCGHNGMALKEEYEYVTFRCAFCNALNPARKARPVGPRLSLEQSISARSMADDSSDTDTSVNEDSGEDHPASQQTEETVKTAITAEEMCENTNGLDYSDVKNSLDEQQAQINSTTSNADAKNMAVTAAH